MAINQNDIIYFVLTDRFYEKNNPSLKDIDKSKPFYYHGGNIDGLIEKIPYLKNLGITALWITPVYLQIPPLKGAGDLIFGYHGYWPVDFNSIDPHLYIDNPKYPAGSKNYLKDLADRLHENAMKLILDMVVNHVGYGHPGCTDTEPNPTPIRSDWFNKKGLSCNEDMIQGELACLPDMDLDNPDVADYHIETIISWIKETGIDGVRMDTVKHVERIFWNYFKTQVRGKYPDVSLIGEVLEFDANTISEYQKYWGFDSLFDFPVQRVITNVFIHDQSLKAFVSPFNIGTGLLEKDNYYTNHNKLVTLLDNHDLEARFMSLAIQKVGGKQNMQHAVSLMKLALSFMFSIRGIPQIYYGTEVGMEGFFDPDNRRDFDWNMITDTNEVDPSYKAEKEIFDHLKNLIRIRKENDVLYCGNFVPLYVDDFVLAYLRYICDQAIVTVIHNGWIPMPYPLSISINNNDKIPQRIKNLLNDKRMKCLVTGKETLFKNGEFSVKMDGKSAYILK